MEGTRLFQYLEELPVEDFVLHGSPTKLSEVEPRQAFHRADKPEHNEFAIYGTLHIEIAILYAILPKNLLWGWKIDPQNPREILVIVPTSFKGSVGYVHVLPRGPFINTIGGGLILTAHEPIVPVKVLEVHPNVLRYLQDECSVRIETLETT